MTRYKVRVEGFRLYEAASPEQALAAAALDIKLMDFRAAVVGGQDIQGLDVDTARIDSLAGVAAS